MLLISCPSYWMVKHRIQIIIPNIVFVHIFYGIFLVRQLVDLQWLYKMRSFTRYTKRFNYFVRLISTKLWVLLESIRIVIFLLFLLALSFIVFGSISRVIVATDIMGFLSQMFWKFPFFIEWGGIYLTIDSFTFSF